MKGDNFLNEYEISSHDIGLAFSFLMPLKSGMCFWIHEISYKAVELASYYGGRAPLLPYVNPKGMLSLVKRGEHTGWKETGI